MSKKIRHEIEWVKHKKYLVTSVIIWNDQYDPTQFIVFRDDNLAIRSYCKLNDTVHREDFLVNHLRTSDESEVLFSITNRLRQILNKITLDDFYQDHRNEDIKEDVFMELINLIFLDDKVMESLLQSSPDFGFYSLSPNYNKLKMIIKEGRVPTLFEEVMYLKDKYKNG